MALRDIWPKKGAAPNYDAYMTFSDTVEQAIDDNVIGATIDGDGHLLLEQRDGSFTDAGELPPGPKGDPGGADDADVADALTTGPLSQAAVIAQTETVVATTVPPLIAGKQDAATLGAGVSAVVSTAGAAQSAVDGRVGEVSNPVAAVTSGSPMGVAAGGAARTVALTGHSLVYGQDTSATGTNPPVNGATQTRSSHPTTVEFARAAADTAPSATTLVNQGYPGDRTTESLNRWAAGSSGDVEVFWVDTNDAMNYASRPGGPLDDAGTRANLWSLVKRARGRGADVIVVGGAPVSTTANARKIFASAQTDRSIAERLGARWVDMGDILNDVADLAAEPWTDGVHWTPAAYSLAGARLAALLGPKGIHPPVAGLGRVLSWRDQCHIGGTFTARGSGISGKVITVADGTTCTLPFEAIGPTLVRVRVRVTTDTRVEIRRNLDVNRAAEVYDLRYNGSSSQDEHVWLTALATMSPGPSAISVKPVGGQIQIVSWEFVNVPNSTTGPRTLNLPMVGGKAPARLSASWDACLDLNSAVALRRAGTAVNRQWLFNGMVGPTLSGIILVASQRTSPTSAVASAYIAHTGVMVLRSGADLIIRPVVDGSGSGDTTVAGAFPSATGVVPFALEVVHDASNGDLRFYLAGALVHTITAATYKTLMVAALTGASSGEPFAAIQGSVR